jgi:hypothetical protein
MQVAKDIMKIAVMIVVIAVAVFMCLRLHQLGKDEAVLVGGAAKALDTVNADCSKKDGGTLCLADKDLVATGDLIKRSDVVVEQERQYLKITLPMVTSELMTTLGHLDQAAGDAHPLMMSVKARVDALADVETNAAAAVASVNTTVLHTDARIQSQDVTDMMHGASRSSMFFAQTTEHVASTTATFDAVSAKLAAPYLNPKPKHWYDYVKPTWQTVWQVLMVAK